LKRLELHLKPKSAILAPPDLFRFDFRERATQPAGAPGAFWAPAAPRRAAISFEPGPKLGFQIGRTERPAAIFDNRPMIEIEAVTTARRRAFPPGMTESSAAPPRDFGILKALLLVLIFAAWNALSDVLYDDLGLDGTSRADPRRIAMIVIGTFVTCGGVVWLGCVVWAGRSLGALGWRAPRPARIVSLGLALTALLFAGVFGFVALLGGAQQVHVFAEAVMNMPASERIFFTILGAKVAFAEETLFRGLLLSALARKMAPLAAIVLSSVAFGLYHRSVFPVPFLMMKVAVGMLLAAFALASRSLVPGWIGHWLLWSIAGDN
jgi:membrane protease YdiL (CAAX protease family)